MWKLENGVYKKVGDVAENVETQEFGPEAVKPTESTPTPIANRVASSIGVQTANSETKSDNEMFLFIFEEIREPRKLWRNMTQSRKPQINKFRS